MSSWLWDIERGVEIPEDMAPFKPTHEQTAFTRYWESQGTWNPVVDVEIDWCEPLDPMYRPQ
jgi:hypothetical protein